MLEELPLPRRDDLVRERGDCGEGRGRGEGIFSNQPRSSMSHFGKPLAIADSCEYLDCRCLSVCR